MRKVFVFVFVPCGVFGSAGGDLLAVHYRQKEGSFCATHAGRKEMDVKDIQKQRKTEVKHERNENMYLSLPHNQNPIRLNGSYMQKCC